MRIVPLVALSRPLLHNTRLDLHSLTERLPVTAGNPGELASSAAGEQWNSSAKGNRVATTSRDSLPRLKSYPGPQAAGGHDRPQNWEIMLAGDLNDKHSDLLQTVLDVPRGSRGVIYFDSNGGSVYTSLSLMSLIRLRNLDATGVVLGECSSAALLPFAACRRRFVTPFSTLLFHAMKWESEENVRLHEAAEWARHFQAIEKHFDGMLAELFEADPQLLQSWTEPGRFISGEELANAGLAELVSPLEALPAGLFASTGASGSGGV